MTSTTDHPGEGWVAVGPERPNEWTREFAPGVVGNIWNVGQWRFSLWVPLLGESEIHWATAPTAALAAQRVAALADEVRQDVARLAEAWGVGGAVLLPPTVEPATGRNSRVLAVYLIDGERHYYIGGWSGWCNGIPECIGWQPLPGDAAPAQPAVTVDREAARSEAVPTREEAVAEPVDATTPVVEPEPTAKRTKAQLLASLKAASADLDALYDGLPAYCDGDPTPTPKEAPHA